MCPERPKIRTASASHTGNWKHNDPRVLGPSHEGRVHILLCKYVNLALDAPNHLHTESMTVCCFQKPDIDTQCLWEEPRKSTPGINLDHGLVLCKTSTSCLVQYLWVTDHNDPTFIIRATDRQGLPCTI